MSAVNRTGLVVTDITHADPAIIDALGAHGVATVHEAMGRTGLIGAAVTPIQSGARIGGSAVTVLNWPSNNLMIHAAVEQCKPGDILVAATVSPSLDGSFGELFATALQRRGVRGFVTTAGVRDVVDLREMGFPVWSAAVNAQGTDKAIAGSVNVPILVGGTVVHAGDVILADDDGVLCVPRGQAEAVREASDARVAKEAADREAYQRGDLSIDRKGLRQVLANLGVTYITENNLAGE
jgi:4-hydroxy-4-methyl-2-oxoglutarate aldolase